MAASQQALLMVSGAAAATWHTAYDEGTPQGTNSSWNGYTSRIVVDKAFLGTAFTKLRLTFSGPFTGSASPMQIGKCYVQQRAATGDPQDYASTPVQVFFGGSASLTLAALATQVSDEVVLALDGLHDLVIGIYSSAASNYPATWTNNLNATTPGVKSYYTAGDSAATVDVSAGTQSDHPVKKLEVYY